MQIVRHNTYLHRLNPILKIIPFISIVVLIFLKTDFLIQIIILAISLALYFFSFVPLKNFKRILFTYVAIFILLFIINWLSQKSPIIYAQSQIDNAYFFGDKAKLTPPLLTSEAITSAGLPTNTQYAWSGGYSIGGYIPNLGEVPNLHGNDYHDLGLVSTDKKGLEAWILNHSDFAKLGFSAKELRWSTLYFDKETWYFGYFVKFWTITNNSWLSSFYISNKLLIVILLSTVFTTTTSTIELTYALEDLLKPLALLRLPVNELAMMISIAIRFVPSLISESLRIMNAQASRGIDFKNGNFKDKITSLTSLIVPLFTIAFLKADDLANAMTARSYNPRYARTRFRTYSLHSIDLIGFGLLMSLIVLFFYFAAKNVIVVDFRVWNATMALGI